MIVRWTSPAAEDLRRIARYIRKDSAVAARHVALTLFESANGLNVFPCVAVRAESLELGILCFLAGSTSSFTKCTARR